MSWPEAACVIAAIAGGVVMVVAFLSRSGSPKVVALEAANKELKSKLDTVEAHLMDRQRLPAGLARRA